MQDYYPGIDEKVLMELVSLAGYLETEAKAGHFPKRRFKRFSDALDTLICDECIALGYLGKQVSPSD